ncbi:TetR/AcrR family transcriptional regulator [Kribbella sp. NPDC051587]|uniref:TetR/AcrR family transcriptional regulator n=1 Tax=Kribbella sp. NPDC051587 TaxID=3364119 RepID=UPI0037879546
MLVVAGTVLAEEGADASMRDIARRAGMGLATLLRHFPTRDALLEALLRTSFDELTARADALGDTGSPRDGLLLWLREFVAFTTEHYGVVTSTVKAIEEPGSALHDSCVALHAAGAQLLARAQAAGEAPVDVDGADLFALVSAFAWLGDQTRQEQRAERLFGLVTSAILSR